MRIIFENGLDEPVHVTVLRGYPLDTPNESYEDTNVAIIFFVAERKQKHDGSTPHVILDEMEVDPGETMEHECDDDIFVQVGFHEWFDRADVRQTVDPATGTARYVIHPVEDGVVPSEPPIIH